MAEIVERPKSFKDVVRGSAQRLVRSQAGLLGVVLVALVGGVGTMSHGASVTTGNVVSIITQSSTRGVASLGQAFVILSAGIDLSVGGVALMSMLLGARLMSGTTAVPVMPIAIMLLAGTAVGVINGTLVSRVGIPALIATLAMWEVTKGAAYQACGGLTLASLPPFMKYLQTTGVVGVPLPIVFFVVASVIGYFILYHTPFGRSVYAVGGNPVSAWLSGVNTKRVLLLVYTIGGFLSALAGLIILTRLQCGSMAAAVGLELDTIAAVVIGGVSLIGGRGNLIGVIFGVMIIGVINNGMNILGIHPAFQSIVKGAIIIAAVSIDYLRRR